MTSLRGVSSVILFGCILLCGCHGNPGHDNQIVARGDDFEVTVPELEQLLRAAPPVARDEVVPARKSILDRLINEKLLAEAGTKAGVDRRPDTMQLIEAMKRSIIANAYADQIAGGSYDPTDAEVARYYGAHPGRYAARRLFHLQEIAAPASIEDPQKYLKTLDQSGLEGLRSALASQGVVTSIRDGELDSALLPDPSQANRLALGNTVFFQARGSVVFGKITAITDVPIPLPEARSDIIAQIKAERREAIIKAQIERLRHDRHVTVNDRMLETGVRKGA